MWKLYKELNFRIKASHFWCIENKNLKTFLFKGEDFNYVICSHIWSHIVIWRQTSCVYRLYIIIKSLQSHWWWKTNTTWFHPLVTSAILTAVFHFVWKLRPNRYISHPAIAHRLYQEKKSITQSRWYFRASPKAVFRPWFFSAEIVMKLASINKECTPEMPTSLPGFLQMVLLFAYLLCLWKKKWERWKQMSLEQVENTEEDGQKFPLGLADLNRVDLNHWFKLQFKSIFFFLNKISDLNQCFLSFLTLTL